MQEWKTDKLCYFSGLKSFFVILLIFTGLALASFYIYGNHPDFGDEDTIHCGFYNMDNLYDTMNDPNTDDDEFTPEGRFAWNTFRYESKLNRMGSVIRILCNGRSPDLLGVCEIENRRVMNDLINSMGLGSVYALLHRDSPDERGSDVALLYNRNKLKLLDSAWRQVSFPEDPTDRTREILWAKLVSQHSRDTLQFIVCHFPSRREGKDQTSYKREQAARVCLNLIREKCDTERQFLVLTGDFNDEPTDRSISQVLKAGPVSKSGRTSLLNLMAEPAEKGQGTYRFKGNWNMLDQIMVSRPLLNDGSCRVVQDSWGVLKEPRLLQKGKYEGYPLRTFGGNRWLDGYSDHLPVYMHIKTKQHGQK